MPILMDEHWRSVVCGEIKAAKDQMDIITRIFNEDMRPLENKVNILKELLKKIDTVQPPIDEVEVTHLEEADPDPYTTEKRFQ